MCVYCCLRLLVSMSASTAESTQRVVSSPQVLNVLANAANSLKGPRKSQTVEAITSLVFALAQRGAGSGTSDVAFSVALQSVRGPAQAGIARRTVVRLVI